MSLFAELKRRRVFRVAGVYAIAAWAAIEVAGTVLLEEGVNAHDWFMLNNGVEPLFIPLRGDPRFDALLRRVNLDPATLPR